MTVPFQIHDIQRYAFSYLSMCENTGLWLFSPKTITGSILTLMIKYCTIFVLLQLLLPTRAQALMLMEWNLVESF